MTEVVLGKTLFEMYFDFLILPDMTEDEVFLACTDDRDSLA